MRRRFVDPLPAPAGMPKYRAGDCRLKGPVPGQRKEGPMPRLRTIVGSLSVAVATLLVAQSPSLAASWKTNVNYGATTPMDLYVPDGITGSPAVVVSLHFC